jgi:ElaB/YqjD/DUF883 family membrane-anchored ribosome-binding protein
MRANGIAPRTQRSGKDLLKEVSVLKSQLRKLSAAMEADAKDGANGALSAIELKSRAVIDEALAAAQSFIDDQTEHAHDAVEKVADLRDAATESLIETVKARPLATLAAVVGIGFVAGFLCRR